MAVADPVGTAGPTPTRESSAPVSVVIPTYNERESVGEVIDRSLSALEAYDAEAVVVDDDSPDGTWRHVRRAYGDDDRVRVVRRTDESGLASAIARGFRESTGEFCVVIDADLQHPPERIPDLVGAFDGETDVVVGSRYADGGGIDDWSVFRRLVSAGAAAVAKAMLPDARGIADPMSGFFAVRRETIEGVDLDPKGYKLLLEVLTKADVDGVVEVPYVFTSRAAGESNLTVEQYLLFVEHVGLLACLAWGFGGVAGDSTASGSDRSPATQ